MRHRARKPVSGTDPNVVDAVSTAIPVTTDTAMLAAICGDMATKEIHNFTGNKLEVYRMISTACGPKCLGFTDLGDKSISPRWFFMHQIEMEDRDTGEIFQTVRSVLIEADLTAYAFVSDGIKRDLVRLIRTFGADLFGGKLKLRVLPVRTGNNLLTYTIVLAD